LNYNNYIEQYDKIGYSADNIITINNFLTPEELDTCTSYLDSITTQGIVGKKSIKNKEVVRILDSVSERFYLQLKEHFGDKYSVPIKKKPLVAPHFHKWDMLLTDALPEHSDCETKDGTPVMTNAYFMYNLTAICYLNDDFTGGQTYFSKYGVNIVPKAGDLLIFPSRYRHGVTEMSGGIRYTLPTWFTFDIDAELEEEEIIVEGNGKELF
jgi:hypothetical protein